MIAMTAPHFAASEAGYEILKNGGTAVEAMVAAAASIAVVYPHMNGLGGDGFWLISEPGKSPMAIDASGNAAALANAEFYADQDTIPSRGPSAALTMAGAVSGWQQALQKTQHWQTPMPLPSLLSHAISKAKGGFEITQSLEDASRKTFNEFADPHQYSGFQSIFTDANKTLKKGNTLHLPQLGNTLEWLSKAGLDDFYQGDIARQLANTLTNSGSPIRLTDFATYQAQEVTPLSVALSHADIYNLPAPTQGIASLMILGLYDRVKHLANTEAEFIHLFVECTKRAFIVRNQTVTDSSRLSAAQESFLTSDYLDSLATEISLNSTLPWPHEAKLGDTIWMGACDNKGRMVSYIQSLYWEFGSGIVCKDTGIVWNNRGTSFSLAPNSLQCLTPGLKPFHTLNPAYAEFHDGSRMVYGTMGGEGQPQTQGTLFCRHHWQGESLESAIAKPRWLLGRTWGDMSHNLKIEDNMPVQTITDLQAKGHDIALVPALSEMMGHAGAIHLYKDRIEAATDQRSDGQAII